MAVESKALTWHGNELYYGRRKMLEVVPDEAHPSMYRVKRPDDALSGMANLSWTKDAALSIAMQSLKG
jgi:hypothetical protein